MDMLRRRSEPGLSSAANEAEENRGDGGEERQQVVQALTDGREVAVVQQTSQVENEVVIFGILGKAHQSLDRQVVDQLKTRKQ